MISKVIFWTDKVIQMQILIGLLGLDPLLDTTDESYHMLQFTQNKLTKDWVKVILGLIQGIMFQDHGSCKSRQGEDAKTLLSKTCTNICERVEQFQNSCDPSQDMNAWLLPYCYNLVSWNLLDHIMPSLVPLKPSCKKIN